MTATSGDCPLTVTKHWGFSGTQGFANRVSLFPALGHLSGAPPPGGVEESTGGTVPSRYGLVRMTGIPKFQTLHPNTRRIRVLPHL